MNSYIINLSFFKIKWYSILILVAIIVAYFIIKKETKKKKLQNDQLIDIFFYCILFGILGARLYYVVFNLDYYLNFPSEMLMIGKHISSHSSYE